MNNKKVTCEQSEVCYVFFDKLFDNPQRELSKNVILPLIGVTTKYQARQYKTSPVVKDKNNGTILRKPVTSKDVRKKIMNALQQFIDKDAQEYRETYVNKIQNIRSGSNFSCNTKCTTNTGKSSCISSMTNSTTTNDNESRLCGRKREWSSCFSSTTDSIELEQGKEKEKNKEKTKKNNNKEEDDGDGDDDELYDIGLGPPENKKIRFSKSISNSNKFEPNMTEFLKTIDHLGIDKVKEIVKLRQKNQTISNDESNVPPNMPSCVPSRQVIKRGRVKDHVGKKRNHDKQKHAIVPHMRHTQQQQPMMDSVGHDQVQYQLEHQSQEHSPYSAYSQDDVSMQHQLQLPPPVRHRQLVPRDTSLSSANVFSISSQVSQIPQLVQTSQLQTQLSQTNEIPSIPQTHQISQISQIPQIPQIRPMSQVDLSHQVMPQMHQIPQQTSQMSQMSPMSQLPQIAQLHQRPQILQTPQTQQGLSMMMPHCNIYARNRQCTCNVAPTMERIRHLQEQAVREDHQMPAMQSYQLQSTQYLSSPPPCQSESVYTMTLPQLQSSIQMPPIQHVQQLQPQVQLMQQHVQQPQIHQEEQMYQQQQQQRQQQQQSTPQVGQLEVESSVPPHSMTSGMHFLSSNDYNNTFINSNDSHQHLSNNNSNSSNCTNNNNNSSNDNVQMPFSNIHMSRDYGNFNNQMNNCHGFDDWASTIATGTESVNMGQMNTLTSQNMVHQSGWSNFGL